jgi:ribonuclease-3
MTDLQAIETIEHIIGYKFKNKSLLSRALVHPSYGNERGLETYQNLEFLGDSILDFIVAEHLIKLYPKADEGELTKQRAAVVSRDPLADVIDSSGLDDYIQVGPNCNPSRKTRSDVFESIVAAIYNDSGLNEARKFIIRFLGEQMKGKKFENDYKSALYELAAKLDMDVEFKHLDTFGPAHRPTFSYEVRLNGETMGYGEDHSKKAAQQEAARRAYKTLKGCPVTPD